MTDNKPLDTVRKAHEEEYFARRNRELVEKMKARLEHDKAVEEIKSASGNTTLADEFVDHLADLGVTRETLPLLSLAPLLEVAWADGEVQKEERRMLLAAAAEQGIKDGSEAAERLAEMLETRPSKDYFDSALIYMQAVLAAMPAEDAERARNGLTELATEVARAHGTLFGLLHTVQDNERVALKHISDRLSETRPDATGDVVDRY